MTHKSNKDKTKPKAHVENSVPSFIRKTYEILEENKFPDIIDWNPEGNALVIKKPAEFCQKVLPAYFKHNNLTSFVRQLNMYNFHKRRTQNIDHVYYHELFQKGKKHLLKEIKRKNHDHSNDKHQKSPEGNENSNKKDLSSIAYENQMLKRLYNEAITKISALETQIQDATAQNQSLWNQISQTTESDKIGNPLTVRFDQQTIVSQPSIPQGITIPPLRFDTEHQNTPQANPFAKSASGLKEEVTDSTATDGSHNSPSLLAQAESDKLAYLPEGGQPLQALQDGQPAQYRNDLFISKKETSVGYLFESWNAENTEIMAFADQKLDRPLPNFQAIPQDVLGKRAYEQNSDVKDFGSEPTKRHELSIFNRRNLISTGTEEKDLIMMRNEDYETNLAVDLMDFNQPFC